MDAAGLMKSAGVPQGMFDSSAFQGGPQGLAGSRSPIPLGDEALRQLMAQLGITDYATPDSYSTNEGGGQMLGTGTTLNDAALQALQGRTFDWQRGGYGSSGTLTGYNPDGGQFQIQQQDTPARQSALEAAMLAAAGFGGAGLAGLGPLAGMFGGAGAAGTAAVDAGAGSGLMGTVGNAGGAGAIEGLTLGAGEMAAGLGSYAGSATPTAALLGNAAVGAGGAAGAAGAGGIGSLLSGLGGKVGASLPTSAQGWMQLLGPVASAGLQSYGAGRAADAQQAATNAALAEQRSATGPYREAGASALQQLMASMGQQPTAQEVMAQPGYQFGLQQGQQALDRRTAAQGGRVSGASLKAAQRYGTDYATTRYNDAYGKTQDRLTRLQNLAAMGSNAATGSANAITGLIGSQGDASAASALAQGNIWGNAINAVGGMYGRGQQPQQQTQPYVATWDRPGGG